MIKNHQGRLELDPKITEAEIHELSHDNDAHIGESEHFKGTLNFLVALKAFGQSVSAPSVAHLMYEESSWIKATEAQDKAGKSGTHWGPRRFEKLRFGRASFTKREAQYFHDAFRQVMGDAWADRLSIEELIRRPLQDNLTMLQQSDLPGPWEKVDPVSALRILAATQALSPAAPKVSIERLDQARISYQGDSTALRLQASFEKTTLPPSTRYQLRIELAPDSDQQVLIIEYSDLPMTLPGEDEAIQGQVIAHQIRDGNIIRVTGPDQTPLEILDLPGAYGFCVISYPFNWDAKEAFKLPASKPLTDNNLRTLAKSIRRLLFQERSIHISDLGYNVPNT